MEKIPHPAKAGDCYIGGVLPFLRKKREIASAEPLSRRT